MTVSPAGTQSRTANAASADELATVLEEIRHLRQRYEEHWPWINQAIVQEAQVEIARGEYQTVEEILNEMKLEQELVALFNAQNDSPDAGATSIPATFLRVTVGT